MIEKELFTIRSFAFSIAEWIFGNSMPIRFEYASQSDLRINKGKTATQQRYPAQSMKWGRAENPGTSRLCSCCVYIPSELILIFQKICMLQE